MENRIHQYKNNIFLSLALLFYFYLVYVNLYRLWEALMLGILWMLVFSLRIFYLPFTENHKRNHLLLLGADMLLLLIICLLLKGSELFFCLSLAEVCFRLSLGQSVLYSVFSFIVFLSASNLHMNMKVILFSVFTYAPLFLISTSIACLVSVVFHSYHQMINARRETEEREVRLQAAYLQLEETASLKERNRIAHRIHDTVGHTLTTAIVALEAARMLWKKDPEKAMEKSNLAHEQVINGLQQIRQSVHMLADDENLSEAIQNILDQTTQNTDINIRYHINIPDHLPKGYAGILVLAIREALANGIRHGGATAFIITLEQAGKTLSLVISDNGRGVDMNRFQKGFGLTGLIHNIEEKNGTVSLSGEPDNGFEIHITLPLSGGSL
ncbi:MAG: hypothetical protein BGN88_13310 [Clostridiales bacterium 43-6]|nr:MAG: hypothetical protein BGN88_13310 [Clostridiales bacterium 43-6]